MELRLVDRTTLHFPKNEWRWLRASTSYVDTPDAFVWAAQVGNALWAWHPRGGAITEGPDKVRVLVLQTQGDELSAHGLYLKTVSAVDPLHETEWVAALQTLKDTSAAPPNCRRYVFLSANELQLLFDRRWDLATFELLEAATPELRKTFVETLLRWNLGANPSKEALGLTLMLSKKMGEKTALHILKSDSFKTAEEFRAGLMNTAQPEFASLSKKRIESLRALNVPARTTVFGDPMFEKDMLKITHTPRKTVDFEVFKAWINDEETMEKVRELLEIYQ